MLIHPPEPFEFLNCCLCTCQFSLILNQLLVCLQVCSLRPPPYNFIFNAFICFSKMLNVVLRVLIWQWMDMMKLLNAWVSIRMTSFLCLALKVVKIILMFLEKRTYIPYLYSILPLHVGNKT